MSIHRYLNRNRNLSRGNSLNFCYISVENINLQVWAQDLSGACVSQRNLREQSGTPGTGRWSVALDGKHPRGLNEFADVTGSKQSGLLGTPWRLRTDPWMIKGKCRDHLQDGQEERNFQRWKMNHSVFL